MKKTHCKRGHERTPDNLASNGACKECVKLASKRWNERNPGLASERTKIWCKNNKEKRRESQRKRRSENIEDARVAEAKYRATRRKEERERQASIPKEIKREYARKWYSNNKDIQLSRVRKRQADKLNRTPKWLTEDHNKQIEAFYIAARIMSQELGGKFEVDHIVPLKGETVSGLHVPWNLQVVTERENRVKNNRFVA